VDYDAAIIVHLPYVAKAADVGGRRLVYFEASRDGVVDREGDIVAADALWGSRKLFLEQGNLDLNHWSWLGNPIGTGARPEYVIGLPLEVKRQGRSIFVKGEIFSNKTPPPPGSSGDWANWFWHSITQMDPPQRWYPSVFGQIKAAKRVTVKGREVRRITQVEWFSVGFAQRAQHPELPPVSTEPIGPLAKAVQLEPAEGERAGVTVMDLGTFAKALTVGVPVTDSAAKEGVQALTPESLDRNPRKVVPAYDRASRTVLRAILRRKLPPRRAAIAQAFQKLGCDPETARAYTERLLLEATRMQPDGKRR